MPELFSREEYDGRLAAVRAEMARRGVDLALISTPENIVYLTGLDDWGYFAPVLLVVPSEGEPVVVTRENKQTTVDQQVTLARFEGHTDSETVADALGRVLAELPRPERIGLEAWSSGLPYGLGRRIEAVSGGTPTLDVTGLVDELRAVLSPAEQAYVRSAARVTHAALEAGLGAIREGVREVEVAAAVQQALISAGASFPGFGPFIRSSGRLEAEHSTWTDARLQAGDAVLLELSGCVARYHAPIGRLVHVGHAPDRARTTAAVAIDAFEAVLGTLRDGALARDVYAAWQAAVDAAGLGHHRRHHCGYLVGIGVPPSWMGGNRAAGLRHDSDLVIRSGMAFHVHSWLIGTGRGDHFLSDTILVTDGGPEVLSPAPRDVRVLPPATSAPGRACAEPDGAGGHRLAP